MGIRRLIVSACAIFAMANAAAAKTVAGEAAQCPASLRAPLIIDLGSMARDEQSPDEQSPDAQSEDHVLIIYAPTRAGWARQRLLSRFRVDPATIEGDETVRAPCFRRLR